MLPKVHREKVKIFGTQVPKGDVDRRGEYSCSAAGYTSFRTVVVGQCDETISRMECVNQNPHACDPKAALNDVTITWDGSN